MPLIASYVLAKCKPRKPKRLYRRLPDLVSALRDEYRRTELYARYWGKPKPRAKPAARNRKPRKPRKPPARG